MLYSPTLDVAADLPGFSQATPDIWRAVFVGVGPLVFVSLSWIQQSLSGSSKLDFSTNSCQMTARKFSYVDSTARKLVTDSR